MVLECLVSRFPPRTCLLFAGVLLACCSAPPRAVAQAPAPVLHSATRARLSELLDKLPKGAEAGLYVADVATGEEWCALNADLPLKPASVQKLFVTAAALERFGPGFRFETRVYVRDDEVWIIGSGDPALGDQRIADRHHKDIDAIFDEWASALKNRGLKSVSRVVLDDSVFDEQVRHSDWPRDQSDRWYQAPVGAFNLNDNCLDVEIVLRGSSIELRLQPDLPADAVRNGLKRGKQQRATIKRLPDSDLFQVQGTVKSSAELDPVAVYQPTRFFAQALQRALEQRGIAIRDGVVRRKLAESDTAAATLVATHVTPLPDVLWRCNTFSQNLFAECLLKSLAAYEPDGRRSGVPGSWEAGRAIERETLAKLGVDPTGAPLRDGSGLSHANRATAAQFVTLLVKMRHHACADIFLQSLAAAGEDGSMKNRYRDPALHGRLRGKTGTIAGVHTFAGYLTRRDGTVLALALLLNGEANATLPIQVCKVLLNGE